MPDITWAKYEKDISSNDPQKASRAAEAFIEEREKQTKTSETARKWEADRKAEVAKNKIQWKKDQIKKDKVKEFGTGLRSWSGYQEMIQPCANYLLVKVEEQESKTSMGIIVATEQIRNNIGYCVAIGGDYIGQGYKLPLPPPCKVGDKIMFKLGAGIEIEIKGEKLKFMTYTDVLGIFKDD